VAPDLVGFGYPTPADFSFRFLDSWVDQMFAVMTLRWSGRISSATALAGAGAVDGAPRARSGPGGWC
jgi:hypothetical protein